MSRAKSALWIFLTIAFLALPQYLAYAGSVPDPGQKGPYAIGHTSFVLVDQTRSGAPDFQYRPIPVSIWYPVDPASIQSSTPEASYLWDPIYNFPQLPHLTSVSSDWEPYGIDRAFQDPTPATGPFPLVMFSPGWGAPIWLHTSMATRLASHGFVVAVMYHFGDAWWPWELFDPAAVAAFNRPRDVSFVLTNILERNQTKLDPLYHLIQPQQVAAAGWSMGGYGALTLASGDDSVCDLTNDAGDAPPWTCEPSEPDPRIKAIVLLDAANQGLHFSELARVKVPSIGIGEEWNAVLDFNARAHAALSGHPAYRVDINNSNHHSFGDICEASHVLIDQNTFPEAGYYFLPKFCSSEVIPSAVAHQLTYKYMIAFLNANIAGVSGYENILTPGWALTREQHVEFFVTERRSANSIDDDWPNLFVYFPHQPGSTQARAEKDPKGFRPIPHLSASKQ